MEVSEYVLLHCPLPIAAAILSSSPKGKDLGGPDASTLVKAAAFVDKSTGKLMMIRI